MIQLEHNYIGIPIEVEKNGEPVAADSLPTAVLFRNGSATVVTVTITTTAETGLYNAAFTTLGAGDGWTKTDRLVLRATAVIDSTTYKAIVWNSFGEVDAPMRGTDNANTTTPPTPNQIMAGLVTGSQPTGSLARFVRDIKQADVLFEGQIVTAAAQSATLDAGATTVCIGQAITIGEEGDVDRQTRWVTAFDSDTKVVTLDKPWCVVPDDGASYQIKTQRRAIDEDEIKLVTSEAIELNQTISSLDSMIEDVSGNRFTKKALEQTSGGIQAYSGLKRSLSDDTAINFVWPTIDTITAEKSFNGGSYSAISGSITFLRTENDENWYSLSYNYSDRPTQEGTVRYKLTDGDVTKFLNVYVYDTAEKVIESVESSETTILNAISNIDVDLQPLLDALEDLDIDLTPVLEAIEQLKLKISSSVIQIISPLSSDGTTLTVIQGDDYLTIDGRNILFTSDIEDQWPDLTNSNIVFGVYGTNILKGCVVISGTGTQQISLELTSIDTFVPQGTYDYDVQATLENGSVITLFRGKFISVKSYTN